MRFVDEFRDPELGRAVAGEILASVEPGHARMTVPPAGHHRNVVLSVLSAASGGTEASARPAGASRSNTTAAMSARFFT